MAADKRQGDGGAPACGRIGDRPYWVLLGSVAVRAVHQVGGGVVLASVLLSWPAGPPAFYFWLAVLSGVLLTGTESLRHRQWYRELAGVSTLLKLLLLGAAYHRLLPAAPTVCAAFLLAALAAHLPRELRHRLLY